jgi:hypothetical protein
MNGNVPQPAPGTFVPIEETAWSLEEGLALCTAIHEIPSQKFNCHPALTGGLLYKQGPRKDCDIVIYQRGDVDGKREPIDWANLWVALLGIGLELVNDFGYVKKCRYRGKTVDVFDPTQDGGNYGQGDDTDQVELTP